ncbi:MAG: hypothetical protein ABIJ31_03020 [Pseudomonadota bacterium]
MNYKNWMVRLAPVRDELLRGDLRSLYIGWPAAVTGDGMADHETEPLSVCGLGSLTSSQQALAEFLEVDPDLLAGAGIGNPAAQDQEMSQNKMDEWIDGWPIDAMKAVMKQLLEGKGQQAERSLKSRFVAWQRSLQDDKVQAPRRTVGELRNNVRKTKQIRLEREKHDQKQQEIKRCKEREVYLKNLANNFPKMWKSVQYSVERGSGLGYDEACCSIVDIKDAYMLLGNQKHFQQELKKFMEKHLRRKALIERLVKAGIWKDK